MRIECVASPWKLIGLLVLTSATVGVCYFYTTLRVFEARLLGWIGVGFFSPGLVILPCLLCWKGPILVIDEVGIDDRRWKLGVIPWEEIDSLSIVTIQSTRLLRIELIDPKKYLSQLPKWQRALAALNVAMGQPRFTISFTELDPGLDEVWTRIQSWNGLPAPARDDR